MHFVRENLCKTVEMPKPAISSNFDDRDASTQNHPNVKITISPQVSRIEAHFVREGSVFWASIDTALPP